MPYNKRELEIIERCAKVADDAAKMRLELFRSNEASINAHRAMQAEEIATAIRNLAGGPNDVA